MQANRSMSIKNFKVSRSFGDSPNKLRKMNQEVT